MKKKVSVFLDLELLERLNKVADLAFTTPDVVAQVLLALDYLSKQKPKRRKKK